VNNYHTCKLIYFLLSSDFFEKNPIQDSNSIHFFTKKYGATLNETQSKISFFLSLRIDDKEQLLSLVVSDSVGKETLAVIEIRRDKRTVRQIEDVGIKKMVELFDPVLSYISGDC